MRETLNAGRWRHVVEGLDQLVTIVEAVREPLEEFTDHRRSCERCNAAFMTGGSFALCREGLALATEVLEAFAERMRPQPSFLGRIVARLRR